MIQNMKLLIYDNFRVWYRPADYIIEKQSITSPGLKAKAAALIIKKRTGKKIKKNSFWD